ncbi:anti-repressor SinI family protein [Metabacillus litoralis]|nr:anti-repressor SinI family protein [Metabacillus litoralis]MCM3165062.1 anti-repressor SinI family protein [Metabacillus litoralis]MCM3412218.1 anti-repressor SinI family protein [Metabacillus litoralis]
MENTNLLNGSNSNQEIDQEWVQLILEAKNLGMTPEEIHDFFKNK